MRLLIDARTIQDAFPGIGRYVYNLTDALAPILNGEILALTPPVTRNSHYDLSSLTRHPNLTLIPCDIPIFSWRVQTDLPRLIHNLAPDLIHFPYNVRPFRLNLPSVLTLYDAIPRLYPAYFSRRRRWQIEFIQRFAIRSSKAFVAISQATAADFHALYSIPDDLITPTPLAADPIFQPQPPAVIAALRQRLGLPERYVLYVGSNKPHKNLPRLIAAWRNLQPATLNLQPAILLIAGAWDDRYPAAKQLVESLGLAGSVHFLSSVSNADLPGLYTGAELFIFPSLYEGFGLPVIEAMACGVPVACSNTSSLPEVAGDAALYFDPVDVADMAAAISGLLADPTQRSELSEKGLTQATSFTWARTAAATLAAYRSFMHNT